MNPLARAHGAALRKVDKVRARKSTTTREIGISALGRIRTCDTRFRKPALYSSLGTPENANEHAVFAFSRSGAFPCSVSDGG
jgi:hypothetical protein